MCAMCVCVRVHITQLMHTCLRIHHVCYLPYTNSWAAEEFMALMRGSVQ